MLNKFFVATLFLFFVGSDVSAKAIKKNKIEEKKEEIVQEEPFDIIESNKEDINIKNLLPKENKIDESDLDIFAGIGIISEKYNENVYNSLSFHYGLKKDISYNIGYKFNMDLSQQALIALNKIQIKSEEKKNNQYFFSFGIGNRLGMAKRSETKLSDNLSSYSLIGVGVLQKYNGINFDLDLGTTINSSPSLNISLMGSKKIGNQTIGIYFDIISTDPKIAETNQFRQLISSGLILSF